MNEATSLLMHPSTGNNSVRKTTWDILHYKASAEHKTRIERISSAVEIFILNLILVNVLLTIWASLEIDETSNLTDITWYFVILVFSTIVFSIEYVLRLWSCVQDKRYQSPVWGRLRWMFQPLSLIDLIAIIPFYLEIFVAESITSTSRYRGAKAVRALRLLRVLSFLRIERSYSAVKKMRRIFTKKRQELLIVSYITAVVILISASTIFFLEHDAQPQVFSNIAVGAWWTVETITSLGYGDAIPITTAGQVFGSLVALWGIVLFSVPGAIIGSGFIEVMLEHQKENEMIQRETILQSIVSQRTEKSSLLHTASRKSFYEADDSMTEQFNQLLMNQRLLELQLQCQKDQLDTIVSLLRSRRDDDRSTTDEDE